MSRSLVDLALELAWSQWVALGVSGSGVSVAQHVVDLEAAIAFAPILAELDPRLHDEVLDWCITYARHFTSVSCLKHCLKRFDPEHGIRFERFAAIVNAHGRTKWPTSQPARRFSRSGKSKHHLELPSCVQLRARKTFGINARADILVGLALYPPSPKPLWTHVNAMWDLGYSKRNLSEALTDLHAGGMVGTFAFGNTVRYALMEDKVAPLRALLAPLPTTVGQPWAARLALVASLIELQRRTHDKSVTTQVVEARKLLERRKVILARSQIAVPNLELGSPWPQLAAWLEPMLRP